MVSMPMSLALSKQHDGESMSLNFEFATLLLQRCRLSVS